MCTDYQVEFSMTANVDFFCTKSEEQIVIRYLLKDKNVVMYDVFGDKLRQSDTTTLVSSSDWESELSLFSYTRNWATGCCTRLVHTLN